MSPRRLVAMMLVLTACAADTSGIELPGGDAGTIVGRDARPPEGDAELGDPDGAPPPAPDAGSSDPDSGTQADAGPPCAPQPCACSAGMGHQVCRADGTRGHCRCPDGSDREAVNWLRAGVIGRWRGQVSYPWVPSQDADLIFRADGTYEAHGSSSEVPVFYYGLDGTSPLHRYEVFDTNSDESGTALLDVVFDPGGNVVRDELRRIRLSDDEEQLGFEFFHFMMHGPVVFTLRRVGPP